MSPKPSLFPAFFNRFYTNYSCQKHLNSNPSFTLTSDLYQSLTPNVFLLHTYPLFVV